MSNSYYGNSNKIRITLANGGLKDIMFVYVINKNGNSLMPCKSVKAKHLLKARKAKIVRRMPFTIQLLWECEENIQEVIAGMNTGSKKIGCAAITNGKVVYVSQVELRDDITTKMTRRRIYRRTRRNRKTRYRECRFNNRANSKRKERLAPSVKSKLNSHLREKRFVESILPVTHWKIELASFDIHKITNPNVKNYEYQDGNQKGYYNVKQYILDRDNYTCQKCKTKNVKLHVHHIIFRSNNGTDEPNNLITLCESCHDKLHLGEFTIKGIKSKTKHATEIGIIKLQLKKYFGTFEETFGYETKHKREQYLGLSKTHYNDAIVICCEDGEVVDFNNVVYFKKHVAKGDYQQTKGIRSEKSIPTGKIQGFRKFDKVEYDNNIYFIKGRMQTGYAILMNIFGNKIDLKPIPKFNLMKSLSGRKSCMTERTAVNIC